jgi:hypothetical protein
MQPLIVLMVTTSHSKIGDRHPATGIWLEELPAPYYVFMVHAKGIIKPTFTA